jgi:hypothetical protein
MVHAEIQPGVSKPRASVYNDTMADTKQESWLELRKNYGTRIEAHNRSWDATVSEIKNVIVSIDEMNFGVAKRQLLRFSTISRTTSAHRHSFRSSTASSRKWKTERKGKPLMSDKIEDFESINPKPLPKQSGKRKIMFITLDGEAEVPTPELAHINVRQSTTDQARLKYFINFSFTGNHPQTDEEFEFVIPLTDELSMEMN